MTETVERPLDGPVVLPDHDWASQTLADLHGAMAALREQGRFFAINRKGAKALLVTRFDDVIAGFGDEAAMPCLAGARLFAEPAQGRSLFSMTGEEHRVHRALVASAFTPAALERYERDFMRADAEAMLDGLGPALAGGDPVDLVPHFTEPYGQSVIVRILGMPMEDAGTLTRWAHDLVASDWALEKAMAASREFEAYALPVIRRRRAEPGADLISRLATAEVEGQRLADIDIVSFLRILFPAGADTTFRQLGNVLAILLARPGLWRQVLADRSLVPLVIEEALRWEPALAVYPRLVPQDVVWRGAFIPAGTFVLLGVASANRDPRQFTDPDGFDPQRRARRIASFGSGIHFCIGAVLARREMIVALNALLDLYPDLELAEAPRIVGPVMRGPEKLLVRRR
jgi:cytochrome P450